MQVIRKQYKIYIDRSPAEIWRFLIDPNNQRLLLPSSLPADYLELPLVMEIGAIFRMRIRFLGVQRELGGAVTAMEPESLLECRQVDGPFDSSMYRCKIAPFQAGTLITDQIEYCLKSGIGSRLWNRLWLEEHVDRLFLDRQQAVKRCVESVECAA